MSNKGIYTALSGAIAQSQRLETIANNIANANTPAFKRDQQVFKEYLTAFEKMPDVIEAPRIPASLNSFYDMNGGDKSYVDTVGTFTDHTQGAMKLTGNNLDVALDGKGFLEVLTPSGVRYTRHGALKMDNQGRLVSRDGFPILTSDNAGGDPQARTIQLKSNRVSIGANGEIYDGGARIGRLSVVSIAPADGAMKVGASLYKLRDTLKPQVSQDTTTQIHQGALESSNVDIVREMTDMISANRTFETNQRAIKAYDELEQKAVNVVPKLE